MNPQLDPTLNPNLRESGEGIIDTKKSDIGIIVARFQNDHLHEGHTGLLDYVTSRHDNVVVFLGIARKAPDDKDPLDFISRKLMLKELYPQVDVCPLRDMKYNEKWSAKLDDEISKFAGRHNVVLYGSRDSFFKAYKGKHRNRFQEFEQSVRISATEIRKKTSQETNNTQDYRKGKIAARYDQYPTGYMAADILIYDKTTKRVLLGQKPEEDKLRFIGGMFDPEKDTCTKDTAKREALEETTDILNSAHAVYDNFEFVGEQLIDDWRYRSSKSKIISFFYLAEYMTGIIEPNDDISKLEWIDVRDLSEDLFEEEHIVLYQKIKDKIVEVLS